MDPEKRLRLKKRRNYKTCVLRDDKVKTCNKCADKKIIKLDIKMLVGTLINKFAYASEL